MAKPWGTIDALKTDCRWFRGDIPCRPHKDAGGRWVSRLCFYSPVFPNDCMQYLSVESAFDACLRLLPRRKRGRRP